MAEQPDWRPISRLPLIGSMIDGMLQDAEEQIDRCRTVIDSILSLAEPIKTGGDRKGPR